ncbi:hypothetical protein E2C01_075418 [Portunus trituberculatus]|uniref:Uncharacterized protein n=1 Tax=Portunus trituberculatus TaxID=210409 RepID=A0A5B7IF13_PORTR|nr:hypothetical protein [Portunus trituberculatus]
MDTWHQQRGKAAHVPDTAETHEAPMLLLALSTPRAQVRDYNGDPGKFRLVRINVVIKV